MPRPKTVRASLLDFLLWWTGAQGHRDIASHQLQGEAVRWITRDRDHTVNPATVDREWRKLRTLNKNGDVAYAADNAMVVADLLEENNGAEDAWRLKVIDGQNVDTLIDLSDRQGNLFD